MNYPESVQFLYALGNEIKTAKFGLERIRTTLAALGDPQRSLRIIHVAGTNGKGSTCAMIESGLRVAGLRTGLFTSPHLAEPTERIRIDGRAVSAAQFARAFDRVHACAEQLLEEGAIDWHTTYFETVTAMALLIFLDERVDAVVLEVGLGGRLDATNVVTPQLCVITAIDFDHEAFLGKSLESIAGEKAGILKRGVPAVFSRQRPEAEQVLDARAAELGISMTRTEDWRIDDLELDAQGSHFRLVGNRELHISCPLAGEHQVENAATAAIALAQVDLVPAERDAPPATIPTAEAAPSAHRPTGRAIPVSAIERGIAQAAWPGRLERVSEHPEIILDGAHNPAGARALARYIDRFYSHRRVRLIYGAMRDKAVDEIGGILFPRAAQVIVTAPHQARALAPESLREIAAHPNLHTAATLNAALAMVQDAGPNDAIFITGSLFLVAEARAIIGAKA